MASTKFYDDNAGRSYPLLRDEEFAPNSAVVDCGFILGPGAGFVNGQSIVYLAEIERNGNQLIFTFRSDAAELAGRPLRFVRDVDDPPYVIEYADTLDNLEAGSLSESLPEHVCDFADDWTGFLVTGPLEDLLDLLPGDGKLSGQATVEPALVRDTSRDYVRSLNLANGDRTRYETPDGCRKQCWPQPPQELWIVETCLQGPLRFKEGYNIRINQNARDNSLQFSAQVGAGEGEPCDQVKLHDGEEPPPNSTFLEGGLGCSEVVRSINGVGGKIVEIKGGPGVRVSPQPDNNRIVVDVDTHDLAVCAETEVLPSLSEGSVSIGECDCGPE